MALLALNNDILPQPPGRPLILSPQTWVQLLSSPESEALLCIPASKQAQDPPSASRLQSPLELSDGAMMCGCCPLSLSHPLAEGSPQTQDLDSQEAGLTVCSSPWSFLSNLECAPEQDWKRAECPSCHQQPASCHLEPLLAHRDFLVQEE